MTSALLTPAVRPRLSSSQGAGLLIGLVSAASFGLSGSLARSLLDIGWSPTAIVSARIGGAFVVLLIPCLLLLRRIGWPSVRASGRMIAYGVVAIASAQLCYFSAVQYLSIGVALLLEFLAPVLLIGWHWARSGHRPAARVFLGAGLALAGLVLVLDLTSGVRINPIGVLWGLGAAVSLCGYFILSDHPGEGTQIHPLLLTTVGTGVGGLVVFGIGAIGLLPLTARAALTELAGVEVVWWVPLLVLIVVTAALAYLTGIMAIRRLGSSIASFLSLSEVIFAVVFAIVLLGQHPSLSQVLGGMLVLSGIVVVQRTQRGSSTDS